MSIQNPVRSQPAQRIVIDMPRQTLALQAEHGGHEVLAQWPVSTALRGGGEAQDSGCTPRGNHYVRALVGHDQPEGAVFVARRPTGEIWSPGLARQHPGRDWILTRIIWLCGLERGINRGPGVDTFRRFIYIHGTPDSEPMGVPLSHGCIRMRNRDVVALFARVIAGMPVLIQT